MFVCAYYQACFPDCDSINDLKRELKYWCQHDGKPYHKHCVVYHTKRNCSICNEPQFNTPGGWTCKNGHGGAAPIQKEHENGSVD